MSHRDRIVRNAYAREWNIAKYHRRMAEWRTQLGGKCAKCGAVENLEFDHIDPSTKLKTISNMFTAPMDVIQAELSKCQLLCKFCHKEKSNADLRRLYCKRGHLRTPDKVAKSRACKSCDAGYKREYRKRKKEMMNSKVAELADAPDC